MMRILQYLLDGKRYHVYAPVLAGLAASLTVGLLGLILKKDRPSGDLTVQIQQVSTALANINQITESLKGLKDDLQKTETERARIEADYNRVSELKTVTEQQFLAIRTALAHRTIWQVIGDNLLAFFLGVVSSLTASVIWLYFSRRKD